MEVEDIPVVWDHHEEAVLEDDAATVEDREAHEAYLSALEKKIGAHQLLSQFEGVGKKYITSLQGVPSHILAALLQHVEKFEQDYGDTEERIAYLQAQQISNAQKIEKLQEKIDKTCSQAKFISAKNSAALHEFRNKMQENAAASKERNRAICDLTRKRERIENEMKRNELEMERLRKIRKTAK